MDRPPGKQLVPLPPRCTVPDIVCAEDCPRCTPGGTGSVQYLLQRFETPDSILVIFALAVAFGRGSRCQNFVLNQSEALAE